MQEPKRPKMTLLLSERQEEVEAEQPQIQRSVPSAGPRCGADGVTVAADVRTEGPSGFGSSGALKNI